MAQALRERDRLALQYAHLPMQTALRYRDSLPVGLELDDLVSAGWLGLLQAAEMYEPGRGVQFTTYAIALVRGAIQETLRKWDFVPRRVRERMKRSEASVPAMLSLNAPAPGCEEETLSEQVRDPAPGPEARFLDAWQKEALRQALTRLPEREQLIVKLRYGQRRTFREIGRQLGLTEQRVHQLHRVSLTRLRQLMGGAEDGEGDAGGSAGGAGLASDDGIGRREDRGSKPARYSRRSGGLRGEGADAAKQGERK